MKARALGGVNEVRFMAAADPVQQPVDMLLKLKAASTSAGALGRDGPGRARQIDHCLFEFNRRLPLAQAA